MWSWSTASSNPSRINSTLIFSMRNAIARVLVVALIGISVPVPAAAAPEYIGQVIFKRVAVPGATVTVTRGDEQRATSTDAQGIFRFADIADGTWSLTIEMRGFAVLTRDVTIGPDTQPAMWELSLLPFEEISRGLEKSRPHGVGLGKRRVHVCPGDLAPRRNNIVVNAAPG